MWHSKNLLIFFFVPQFLTGGAGSYYHLNHSELVALLVQREAELEEQKEEFERQKSLLAKREVELKKLKPQVKDLEDYIDTLLVRIMEQKPTLLQVRSKFKWGGSGGPLHPFTLTSTTSSLVCSLLCCPFWYKYLGTERRRGREGLVLNVAGSQVVFRVTQPGGFSSV